ncbi:MAG: single-stranded DNA-binding protein [Oscillospiraceae bacterium]|jgi:hypothetical protein|nr:single-stranded DNA-binding protein [Oscillospiraceae bacterium]
MPTITKTKPESGKMIALFEERTEAIPADTEYNLSDLYPECIWTDVPLKVRQKVGTAYWLFALEQKERIERLNKTRSNQRKYRRIK